MKQFTKLAIFATAMLSFSLISPLKAQQYQLPNSGFETFQGGFNSIGQQPTGGWKGSNVTQTALGTTVTKQLVFSDAGGRSGNCVRLENLWVGALGIGAPAPGYISLGTPWNEIKDASADKAIGGCAGGLAFTYRPDTLELWVKRTLANSTSESAHVVVYLWKGTSSGNSYRNKGGSCQGTGTRTDEEVDVRRTNSCGTNQTATIVGVGEWVSAVNQQFTSWTKIKVPVTYYSDERPTKINVIISAANYPAEGQANSIKENSKLWADDLSLNYSSKIDKLMINGRYWTEFNRDVLNYTYSLGTNATTVPPIIAYRSGRKLGVEAASEISINYGGVDAVTTITVNAEDGSGSTTYTINFIKQQSINPNPADILINGNSIQSFTGNIFNPNTYTYNIVLPYGTTQCPTVDVEYAEDGQTSNVVSCNSLPGSATATVYAANTAYFKNYTFNFTVAAFSDNTLSNILINGAPIPSFNPNFNNYLVELPSGTTQAPVITPVSAYADGMQTMIVNSSGFPLPSTIVVFPTNAPSQTRTYTIRYEIVSSSYAYLDDIKVGGVSLEDFISTQTTYNYVLPRGTTSLPTITYEKGEPNQTVNIFYGGVNETTRIEVLAQNGNRVVYYIKFSVLKSENSLLNDILLDGVSLLNFHPDTLIYNIELPSGTTSLPTIVAVAGDEFQTITYNTSAGVNGETTIRVIAENSMFITTYRLRFSVALSANSQLNAILVDGDMLAGFSPEILNYNYILPANATVCPDIEVIKASLGQQVFIIKPALTGVATIRVTSETADGENVYTINFQFELSDDNFLDSIKIDGEILAEFDKNITSYTVTLPQYSVAPAVEYFVSDTVSNLFVIDNGLNGMQITVTAQNGATRTYSINYNTLPTNNVNLANIEIWNNTAQDFVALPNFDAQTIEYQYSLAWRTNTVPTINPTPAEKGQKITVLYNSVNDTTEILVVAPDGVSQKSYFIYFPVDKSNNCALSLITINGAEISDFPPYPNYFYPQILNYNIALPYGTTQMPQVGFEKGKTAGNATIFEQTIEVTAGSFTEPYRLKVIAEDGTTQTYTLNFSIDMSEKIGENYLNNIFVDNVPITNFNSETFEYSIVLPYGTTELPEITFDKRYAEQTVVTDVAGVWGTAKIKAYSNINGIATTEYRINFSVSDVPVVTLNTISFNNTVFNNFNPKVYSYIVPTTAQPTYSYTYNQNDLLVEEIFSNHKKLVLEVADKYSSETNTYTFWYYYTNDVIPNAGFENWSNMSSASGIKPTSWQCQGDVRSSVGLFNLQNQVQRSTNRTVGSYSVYMQGQYNGSTTGDENGLITLGGVTSSGSTLGGHSTSVTGGIDFRNTPDLVKMDYKYTRSGAQNPSMYFAFRLWNTGTNYSSGESVAQIVDTDGTTRDWYEKNYNVSYSGDNRYPKRLNIVLSSNNSENSYSYPTGRRGELWVDNLRLIYNSALSNVYINGVAVAGFNGSANSSYTATVPAETMAPPAVTFANAVPDQEVIYTVSDENASRQRIVTITSKAEDNTTTNQYTIIVTRPIATVNTLAGIKVAGAPIAGFASNTFTYNVTAQNTMFLPNIVAIKGEGHQNVSYAFGNKKVIITVTAENGSTQAYTVNFVSPNADNATLLNLEVSGYELDFDAQTTEYNVVLPNGTYNTPQIIFTKQNNEQTVILTTSSVTGTSIVRVESFDGEHSTDYQIHFSTLSAATSNLLSEIAILNIPINDFAPTSFDYTVQINSNSKFVFAKEFVTDTINIVYFDDSIKCYIGENIYKIVFGTTALNNAYLADIAVNGTSISNYQQTQFTYSQSWDGDNLPDITVKSGAEGQTITVVWSESSINITVVAADGITQNDYTVTFVPSIVSSYSLLENILIDGISLEDFTSNDFNYSMELPDGTTQIPVIVAVKGEPHQTITMTTNGVNNTTTITVTAQDGSQSAYTIFFTVRLSDNAFLTEILINGVLIDGFRSDSLTYDYMFPYGTTTFAVDYTQAHPNQTVTVEDNGVLGQYIITVTSESGDFTNEYVINFGVEPSPYAYLDSILSDGVMINGFYSEVLEYTLLLPYGTENVPNITYIAGDSGQNIVFTNAATLNDTVYISVTSENGVNNNIYQIWFEIGLSENALLSDILINGEPLRIEANGFKADKDFEAEVFEYDVTMPFGTTDFPTVDYVGQVADYYEVNFINNGFDNYSVLEVISQDERFVNEYYIKFIIGKSSNSKLDSIHINGVLLDGFHPDTVHYIIYYPIGTQESELLNDVDVVEYFAGDEYQTVTVEIDDYYTITLNVTAGDGSWTAYIIEQIIRKSENALLADIIIDGKSIAGFAPEKFDYEHILPFTALDVPEEFLGIKQEETQTVDIVKGKLGEISYIYVTAEDGVTENVYTVKFTTAENTSDTPTKDNVCVNYYSEGVFIFTSDRNNVSILIFDTSGRKVYESKIPLADPNSDVCRSDIGSKFYVSKKGQTYVYMFIYNNKTKIQGASGKFLY